MFPYEAKESLLFILIILLLGYIMQIYSSRRRLVNMANKLPSSKLRFYHFLGHIHAVLHHRIFKTRTSPQVYDFMALIGYCRALPDCNLVNVWQAFHPVVIVYKADSAEMILNHSTELKKAWFYDLTGPWLGSGLLTSYDMQWRSRRKILTPAFHFNILKDFLPVFNKQSKILIDVLNAYISCEFVDVLPIINKCSLDITCESILGVEVHSQTQASNPYVKAVLELGNALLKRTHRPWLWPDFCFKISPLGRRFFKNVQIAHYFTNQVITQKKKEKIEKKDEVTVEDKEENPYMRKKRAFLDLLLEEHLNNELFSETDVREEVDTFTFASHHTTSIAISWSLYMIGLHSWVQEKVHSEMDSIFSDDDRDTTVEDLKNMKYLECVIKETLRLYPPVPVFGRQIREDVDFQCRTIPKGSTCIVLSYLLHRDPEVFPNAEKFDPERFSAENTAGRHPFAYVPFSAGPRNCIGQRFAMMEIKTVLSSILRLYHVRALDPRDKIDVINALVLRPEKSLRLEFRPRDQYVRTYSDYYYP